MRMWLVAVCLFTAPLAAAERDFLTAAEVEQVRAEQEPNKRLAIYVGFAKERIAYIEQLLAKEKSGRSKIIHDVLGEYTRIIEAIDAVSDDALSRRLPLDEGLKAVADGEKTMLDFLNRVAGDPPKDATLYRFALEQAILASEGRDELAMVAVTAPKKAPTRTEKRASICDGLMKKANSDTNTAAVSARKTLVYISHLCRFM